MSDINERHGVAIDVNINVTGATEGKQELKDFSKAADLMEQRAKAISGMTITGPKVNMQGTVKQIDKATKQATKYIETNLNKALARMEEALPKALTGDTKATRNVVGYYSSYLMQGGDLAKAQLRDAAFYKDFVQNTIKGSKDMARTQAAVIQGFLTTQDQVLHAKKQELALDQQIDKIRSKKNTGKQNKQEVKDAQNILTVQKQQKQQVDEIVAATEKRVQLEKEIAKQNKPSASKASIEQNKTSTQSLNALKSMLHSPQGDSFTANIKTSVDAINKFEQKLKSTGQIARFVRQALEELKSAYVFDLANTTSTFGGKSTKEQESLLKQLNTQYTNRTKSLEQFHSPFLKLESQLSSMMSFKSVNGQAGTYLETLSQIKAELLDLHKAAKLNPTDDKLTQLLSLQNKADRIKNLYSQGIFKTNTQHGALDLGTFQQIENLEQLDDAAQRYASSLGKIVEGSKEVSKDGKSVTYMVEDQQKQLTKLTTTMDKGNAYMKTSFAGYSNLFGDFGQAFGGIAKQFVSFYGGYHLFQRFLSEARQGIQVLKQYDAALTDISYSMDVSEAGLETLGASAVSMAKDLSTSLENTLGIYQIYANMNTSIQEIEQTAKPTAILANLSGKDALTASDQIQGVLQQFNMLKDESADVAATSMHVVDVLDNVASNVSLDYVKGMTVITDAVEASGAVAYDAGMSYEQLAAVTAKVAERTREDGSTIGNAIKTIVTRLSKVGKMPAYADEVSNEELSKASESLNEIGIAVYNADGSFRELDVILTELRGKWDSLTDAQQSNIAYNIAATRQTSKFKNILESWTEAMDLANMATITSGNAESNQEKYEESYNGKMQKISTQWDAFWLHLYDSKATDAVLNTLIKITGGIDSLAESLGGGTTAALLFMNAIAFKGKFGSTIAALMGFGDKKNLARPKSWSQTNFTIKWGYYHKEYYIMA